jgi:hypothetical protein
MGRDGDGGVARRCSNGGNDDEASSGRGLRVGQVAPYSPLMLFPVSFVALALQAAKASLSTLTESCETSSAAVLNVLARYARTDWAAGSAAGTAAGCVLAARRRGSMWSNEPQWVQG